MTNQTCKIILACKTDWTLDASDEPTLPIDSVVRYLSEVHMCPKSFYTAEVLDNIMFETMCDYLDTCDKPSAFLYQLRDTRIHTNLSLAECIASIFVIVEVYGPTHECINGFREEYISEWENLRAKLMQPNDNKGGGKIIMNFGFDCEIGKRFNGNPDFRDFIRKCIRSFERDHPAGLTYMSSEVYFYRDCVISIVANDSTGDAIVTELCRY